MPKTDKFSALKALRAEKIGVISTASKTGEPWSAAIHFLVDSDFNFYFLTRKSTLKYRHIVENGLAALNVGLMGGVKRGNFQIVGQAMPVKDEAAWRTLSREVFSERQINDLHMDARKDDPFFSLKGHDFVLLTLKPHFIRWMTFSKGEPSYTVLLPNAPV